MPQDRLIALKHRALHGERNNFSFRCSRRHNTLTIPGEVRNPSTDLSLQPTCPTGTVLRHALPVVPKHALLMLCLYCTVHRLVERFKWAWLAESSGIRIRTFSVPLPLMSFQASWLFQWLHFLTSSSSSFRALSSYCLLYLIHAIVSHKRKWHVLESFPCRLCPGKVDNNIRAFL